MALIVHGPLSGRRVTISQWSNDWFTVHEFTDPISPLNLELNSDERVLVAQSKTNGMMFLMFEIYRVETGWRFKRRRICDKCFEIHSRDTHHPVLCPKCLMFAGCFYHKTKLNNHVKDCSIDSI